MRLAAHSRYIHGFNDLATTHPELAAEWHLDNQLSAICNLAPGSSRAIPRILLHRIVLLGSCAATLCPSAIVFTTCLIC